MQSFHMNNKLISIIIRTYNEQKYLDELLTVIGTQKCDNFEFETIIVDSGSIDDTLNIANKHITKITHIKKQNFTFGRSLNIGCDFSNGDILVFISGHCVPVDEYWLQRLVQPLLTGESDYTYGRQIARDTTKFSEGQIFNQYFPATNNLAQQGFYCNNANAAIRRSVWKMYQFDESLIGLEDMHLAKQIYQNKGRITYVCDSCVYHIHNENWRQVKNRYKREAIALQIIMPEIQISILDMLRFIVIAIKEDLQQATKQGSFIKNFKPIITFRILQYYGVYQGNHYSRQLSYHAKIQYFYPKR